MSNTFNETSRWYLIRNLNNFQWRIPSIWCEINKHAKELLDHPSKSIREHIASEKIWPLGKFLVTLSWGENIVMFLTSSEHFFRRKN